MPSRGPVTPLFDYLRFWRTTATPDREIIEAVVEEVHRGPSEGLRKALAEWPGIHYWASRKDAGRLVLVRSLHSPHRERWWLHGTLLVVTFMTVWMGGAFLAGVPTTSLPHLNGGVEVLGAALAEWAQRAVVALPFALAVVGILLVHELGHYLTAVRYRINASPPYFLPAPFEINLIGTFGAFIRLRSPVVDRRQLMDVGAAGPWAGFLVAVAVLVAGLLQSELIPADGYAGGLMVQAGQYQLILGDSILTRFARESLLGDGTVLLHPLAFAGWLGLLVTTLNLLPLAQLDGAHILYSLIGDWQRHVGRLAWVGLVVLGFMVWKWWLVWAALTLILGGGRLSHPRVLEQQRPLPLSRFPTGLASIALFAVTFAPVPFVLM